MANNDFTMAEPIIEDKKQVNNRRPNGTFGPGNVANPNGRPHKDYSITNSMRRMMGSRPEIQQALATKVLEMALSGDLVAIRVIWSYLEGVPGFRREEEDVVTGDYSDLTDEQLDELIKSKMAKLGIEYQKESSLFEEMPNSLQTR